MTSVRATTPCVPASVITIPSPQWPSCQIHHPPPTTSSAMTKTGHHLLNEKPTGVAAVAGAGPLTGGAVTGGTGACGVSTTASCQAKLGTYPSEGSTMRT